MKNIRNAKCKKRMIGGTLAVALAATVIFADDLSVRKDVKAGPLQKNRKLLKKQQMERT